MVVVGFGLLAEGIEGRDTGAGRLTLGVAAGRGAGAGLDMDGAGLLTLGAGLLKEGAGDGRAAGLGLLTDGLGRLMEGAEGLEGALPGFWATAVAPSSRAARRNTGGTRMAGLRRTGPEQEGYRTLESLRTWASHRGAGTSGRHPGASCPRYRDTCPPGATAQAGVRCCRTARRGGRGPPYHRGP